MERTELFDLMGALKLYGMRASYDEVMAAAIKRQHEPPRVVGDLLKAEIAEKHARSIKYQMTIAKLPLAKDLDDFKFEGSPVNEALVRDLAGGGFLGEQRNVVLMLYKAWQQCAEHGIEPGSQKASASVFSVGCDRNNGRPRYSHMRLKPMRVERAPAPLRLAVVSSC